MVRTWTRFNFCINVVVFVMNLTTKFLTKDGKEEIVSTKQNWYEMVEDNRSYGDSKRLTEEEYTQKHKYSTGSRFDYSVRSEIAKQLLMFCVTVFLQCAHANIGVDVSKQKKRKPITFSIKNGSNESN